MSGRKPAFDRLTLVMLFFLVTSISGFTIIYIITIPPPEIPEPEFVDPLPPYEVVPIDLDVVSVAGNLTFRVIRVTMHYMQVDNDPSYLFFGVTVQIQNNGSLRVSDIRGIKATTFSASTNLFIASYPLIPSTITSVEAYSVVEVGYSMGNPHWTEEWGRTWSKAYARLLLKFSGENEVILTTPVVECWYVHGDTFGTRRNYYVLLTFFQCAFLGASLASGAILIWQLVNKRIAESLSRIALMQIPSI